MVGYLVQCACRSVSLRLVGEPAVHGYCHCTDCQLFHQTDVYPLLSFSFDALAIEQGHDHVQTCHVREESTSRAFCRVCIICESLLSCLTPKCTQSWSPLICLSSPNEPVRGRAYVYDVLDLQLIVCKAFKSSHLHSWFTDTFYLWKAPYAGWSQHIACEHSIKLTLTAQQGCGFRLYNHKPASGGMSIPAKSLQGQLAFEPRVHVWFKDATEESRAKFANDGVTKYDTVPQSPPTNARQPGSSEG